VNNTVFPSIPTHRYHETSVPFELVICSGATTTRRIDSGNDVTALVIQPFLGCNKIPELLSYGVSTFWNVPGKHTGVSPWVGKGMDLDTTHLSQL